MGGDFAFDDPNQAQAFDAGVGDTSADTQRYQQIQGQFDQNRQLRNAIQGVAGSGAQKKPQKRYGLTE
jgi:hypothetical protein